jgi:hypothetical protein
VRFRIKSLLPYLLRPKAILLGFTLCYYVVGRVSWERLMSSCRPLPCYPGDHTPVIGDPFKLLFAAFFLVLDRWWGNLIAMLVSGRLIYEYGYLTLLDCSFMRQQPVLSWAAFGCWWHITAFEAPEHLLRIILSLLIFCFAAVSIARYILQRRDFSRGGV